MRQMTFALLFILSGMISRAQTKSYTALKATGDNVPVIDGTTVAI